MDCPICHDPMIHDHLRGYHCHTEQHNELARELEYQIARATVEGRISQRDWQKWLQGEWPDSIREVRREVLGHAD